MMNYNIHTRVISYLVAIAQSMTKHKANGKQTMPKITISIQKASSPLSQLSGLLQQGQQYLAVVAQHALTLSSRSLGQPTRAFLVHLREQGPFSQSKRTKQKIKVPMIVARMRK